MERKTYKAHPKGKRPPFSFDLEDDAGVKTTFVCEGSAQLLDLMDFAQFGDMNVRDPKAARAIAELFENTMGAGPYAAYRIYCRAHDVDPEVTFAILMDMVEYTLNRPLGLSSSSASGRAPTAGMSTGGSFVGRELSGEDIAQWQRTAIADAEARLAEAAGLGGPQSLSMADLARGVPSGTPMGLTEPQRGSQTP